MKLLLLILLFPSLAWGQVIAGDSMALALCEVSLYSPCLAVGGQKTVETLEALDYDHYLYIINTGTASIISLDKTVIESVHKLAEKLKDKNVYWILPQDVPKGLQRRHVLNMRFAELRRHIKKVAAQYDHKVIDISHIEKGYIDEVHYDKATNRKIWNHILKIIKN